MKEMKNEIEVSGKGIENIHEYIIIKLIFLHRSGSIWYNLEFLTFAYFNEVQFAGCPSIEFRIIQEQS